MNVLFVEKRLRSDKLGIMCLSAMMIRDGHSVYMIQDDLESTEQYMRENQVDVVCWSMMTSDAPWMFAKNKELKSKFKFVSIVGGQHPTFFPDEAVNDPNVDRVVIGPGELVINDILSGKNENRVTRGSIPDVDLLPNPYRDPIYRYEEFGKARVKRFIAGRYCYYNCTYCFNNKLKSIYKDQTKRMWKRKSVPLMMAEIDEVKARWGLEHANFNDDNIAADRDWIEEFCDEMEKRKLEWCGLVCANSMDQALFKRFKESGCDSIFMGVEAANKDTQKLLGRHWQSSDEIFQAVRWGEEAGIKMRTASIIGFPVDDPLADALETLEFNQRAAPSDAIIAVFQPYKGTVIWDYCYEKGLIDENVNGGTFYEGTKMKIKDSEKINRLFSWWPYFVKYKVPMDLVHIILDIPLSDEIKNRLQQYKWNTNKKIFFKIQ